MWVREILLINVANVHVPPSCSQTPFTGPVHFPWFLCTIAPKGQHLRPRDLLQRLNLELVSLFPHPSTHTHTHTHTHRTESGWELSTLHSLPSTALLLTDWFRRSKLTPLPLGWANSWVIHKFSVGYMV